MHRFELLGEVLSPPAVCEECIREEEAEEEAERHRQGLVARERLLRAAGGGRRLQRYSLASFPRDGWSEAALATARWWASGLLEPGSDQVNLLIFGPVGTGKTGLAWGLLREVIKAGTEGQFVTFRDLLWQLRRSFSTGEPCDVAERAARVPLLVLDDLGAERPTDFARDELSVLVEHRYMNELPTIVTSNYTPDRLATRLGHDEPTTGQRIVSRLAEGAVQIRLEGPDRRAAS